MLSVYAIFLYNPLQGRRQIFCASFQTWQEYSKHILNVAIIPGVYLIILKPFFVDCQLDEQMIYKVFKQVDYELICSLSNSFQTCFLDLDCWLFVNSHSVVIMRVISPDLA